MKWLLYTNNKGNGEGKSGLGKKRRRERGKERMKEKGYRERWEEEGREA